MSPTAAQFALVAMLAWGLWAALADVATRSIPPEMAMIVSYVTSVAVATTYVITTDKPINLAGEGVAFAAAAGIFAGIGAVAFYSGLSVGRTGIVTTISAMYFIVAALIGIAVLGDSLSLRDAAGIGFAVLAIVLLTQ